MPPIIGSQLIGSTLPFLLFFGIIFILLQVFRILLPNLKGRIGEAAVNNRIRRSLDPSVYHLIPDVMLPTPDGTTQIDHVIVSRYGIFVLETKAYKGWIYGDERQPQWTQVVFKRKSRFQNPLRQNYKHTKTLADLTGIPDSHFKSMVVFTGDCTFKTEMPANVMYGYDLGRYIKGFQTPIIKDGQVQEIVDMIQKWAGTVTDRQKADHVANLRCNRSVDATVDVTPGATVCPRCGSVMVQRSRRSDGGQFWGCSKYPSCRGIRGA